MIIEIDSEKVFNKIQYPFMRKVLNKLGIEGKFLNLIRATLSKQLGDLLLRSGTSQECSFSQQLFSIALKVLDSAIRQKKREKNKGIHIRREKILFM